MANLLPTEGRIIGLARTEMDTPKFIELAHDAVKQFSRTGLDEEAWAGFTRRLAFVHLKDGSFDEVARDPSSRKRVIYLATPPTAVPAMVAYLAQSNLQVDSRLVLEKPFGEDLRSARDVSHTVSQYFDESQVFRIDHYLGKETVQNILVFRFGNSHF